MTQRPARLVRCGSAVVLALLGLSLPFVAHAAEPESVVVRNRLYSDDGRLELQLNYSFGLANTLTATQGPVLDVGYHLSEAWVLDLLVGYFFGGPTDLFGQAQCPGAPAAGGAANCPNSGGATSLFAGGATAAKPYSDVPSLWTMNGLNAQVGVRWEPVYGKLSLFTALPVHFKWFFALDAGLAQFSRDSLDFCTQYDSSAVGGTGDCAHTGSIQGGNFTYKTLQQSQFSWVGSAATGLRFIFLKQASIDFALREYVWGDSYLTSFQTTDFGATPSSKLSTQSGITPSLFADIGLGWTF